MAVGMMRKIQYKNHSTVSLPSGGTKDVYTLGETDWAEISNETFSKGANGLQVQDDETYQFKVRWRENLDINSKTIVVYNGKEFVLVAPPKNENERNFYYILIGRART